jgi:Flp pilus assembly protein TadG
MLSYRAFLIDNGWRETMKKVSNLRGQARSLLHGFCRAQAACGASVKARSIGGRFRALLRSDVEGQSLVEFALVLPMLALVLMGIFTVGLVMQNYQQLTYVENQGLITLQQLPNTSGASDPCNAVATAVIGAAANLKTSGTSGIQMSITFGSGSSAVPYPSSGMSSPSGFTCSTGSAYAVDGNSVTLTVTYPSKVLGFNPTPNGLMTITETEQI